MTKKGGCSFDTWPHITLGRRAASPTFRQFALPTQEQQTPELDCNTVYGTHCEGFLPPDVGA